MGYSAAMAEQSPRTGITIEPRVIIAGAMVAAVGVAVLALYVWMVPKAAALEARAACTGLKLSPPNPVLCPGGRPCSLPLPAPDFTVLDHANRPVKLSSFRGKVVLLNFWASWCGVCKTEKPKIDEMAAELGSDKFQVVALASDHSWSDVLVALVEALRPELATAKPGDNTPLPDALAMYNQALPDGTPFQVYLDPPAGDGNIGKVADAWGIKAVPESFLIDRQGNIRAYFVNKRDWSSSVAVTCLRSIIDEP
jgi:thiol-disulfide isomerase/thioredoxin